MAEKKLEYDLMPATPSISEGYGEEKKKKGFRKLFSNFTKKRPSDLGKSSSISEAVRFEGDEEEQNGRRSISLFTPGNQSDVDPQDFQGNNDKQNLVHHNDSVDEASEEEIEANKLEAPKDDISLLNLMERAEELSIVHQDNKIDGPEIELPKSDPSPEANEGNATGEEDELQQNESPTRQEKEVEVIGCESLLKGLQKICLPWTLTKDE